MKQTIEVFVVVVERRADTTYSHVAGVYQDYDAASRVSREYRKGDTYWSSISTQHVDVETVQ